MDFKLLDSESSLLIDAFVALEMRVRKFGNAEAIMVLDRYSQKAFLERVNCTDSSWESSLNSLIITADELCNLMPQGE